MAPPIADLDPTETAAGASRGDLTVVDLRDPGDFAKEHPRNAINVPYSRRNLHDRVLVVIAAGSRLALLAADPAQLQDAGAQLRQGGTFQVAGGVRDGMVGWRRASLPVSSLTEIPVAELIPTAGGQEPYLVLDVREPLEWETGYIPGALLISLGDLRDELPRVPRDRPVAVLCEAGVRSATAASVLRAAGYSRVVNIPEGTAGYRRSGYPLTMYPPGS